MIRLLFFSALALSASSAFAYKDGTYTCRNAQKGLPPDVYVIKTVEVDGVSVPHLDITRHFRRVTGDPNSPVQTAHTKGFAMVASVDGDEILALGSIRLEFDADRPTNCK